MLPLGSAGRVLTHALPKIGQICVRERGSMFCRGLLRKPMKLEKLRLLLKEPLGLSAAPSSGNRVGPVLSRGTAWRAGTGASELGAACGGSWPELVGLSK